MPIGSGGSGGGATPNLAAVLAAGGDPGGNPVTNPFYIDNASATNAGLTVDAGDANSLIALLRKSDTTLVGRISSTTGSFSAGADHPTIDVGKAAFFVYLKASLNGSFAVVDYDGNTILDVEVTGGVTLEPPPGSTDNPFRVFTEAGSIALNMLSSGATTFFMSLLANAGLVIHAPSAPADADISAGQCALWFDQTNGAGNTKLMAKGKSTDGTVKTATVATLA